MRTQGLKFIVKQPSLDKYLSKNVANHIPEASEGIYAEAVKKDSGIRKVVIKGRGFRLNQGYGGVDVVVVRNKKYKLLPGKKVKQTMDNAYMFGNKKVEDTFNDLQKLFSQCKQKLGLKKD